MKDYLDDLLVKSMELEQHMKDLGEAFVVLNQYKMKLNQIKCAFQMQSGKFLGFMVLERGIKANPEKLRVIIDIKLPTNLNEVQKLEGKIVALNRFVSRSTNRCLPFSRS